MIQGWFGSYDELFFEIELIAEDGSDLPVEVILDTGFSDWLVIDKQDVEAFDWEYLGERNMLLAQGEGIFDIYAGKVRIEGQEFDIPVYAGESVSEILFGRQWLKTRRLVVDMSSGILTLG
ncbi:aspartyl protease [Nostoc sp. FACHB-110]|uniref:aspartyl protease n=1 Tax=Nostoc sp. FACHB-110 TaxID=2692834 RepID=UPI001683EBA2|nr:aspartyl protease [Nostoc sp. FACHB-110]MBD2438217.1 aspartyl protease [Nostoc sp. FACHB-110]